MAAPVLCTLLLLALGLVTSYPTGDEEYEKSLVKEALGRFESSLDSIRGAILARQSLLEGGGEGLLWYRDKDLVAVLQDYVQELEDLYLQSPRFFLFDGRGKRWARLERIKLGRVALPPWMCPAGHSASISDMEDYLAFSNLCNRLRNVEDECHLWRGLPEDRIDPHYAESIALIAKVVGLRGALATRLKSLTCLIEQIPNFIDTQALLKVDSFIEGQIAAIKITIMDIIQESSHLYRMLSLPEQATEGIPLVPRDARSKAIIKTFLQHPFKGELPPFVRFHTIVPLLYPRVNAPLGSLGECLGQLHFDLHLYLAQMAADAVPVYQRVMRVLGSSENPKRTDPQSISRLARRLGNVLMPSYNCTKTILAQGRHILYTGDAARLNNDRLVLEREAIISLLECLETTRQEIALEQLVQLFKSPPGGDLFRVAQKFVTQLIQLESGLCQSVETVRASENPGRQFDLVFFHEKVHLIPAYVSYFALLFPLTAAGAHTDSPDSPPLLPSRDALPILYRQHPKSASFIGPAGSMEVEAG